MKRENKSARYISLLLSLILFFTMLLPAYPSKVAADSADSLVTVRVEGSKGTIVNDTMEAGPTALDGLTAVLNKNHIQYEIISSIWGKYVASIEGETATNGYWMYYVIRGGYPDEDSYMKGADSYVLHEGDEVVFYYDNGQTQIPSIMYDRAVEVNQPVTVAVYTSDNQPAVTASVYFEDQVYSINSEGITQLPGQSEPGTYEFTVSQDVYGGAKLVRSNKLQFEVFQELIHRSVSPPAFKGISYHAEQKTLTVTGASEDWGLGSEQVRVKGTLQQSTKQIREAVAPNYGPFELIFTGVMPGEYTISIQAIDKYGNQSTKNSKLFEISTETASESEALTRAVSFLKSKDYSLTGYDDWTAMGLAKSGVPVPGYLEQLTKDVTALTDESSTTDIARLTLAVLAVGGNPRNFSNVNLLQILKDRQDDNGHFGLVTDDPYSWSNEQEWTTSHSWAILALKQAGEDIPNADQAVKWLTDHQHADGGWGFSIAAWDVTDPDMTAYVIRALAALGKNKEEPSVKKALDYFLTIQQSDGGMGRGDGSGNSNVFTTIEVVTALNSLDVNPKTWMKGDHHPLSYLLANQEKNGQLFNERGTSGMTAILLDMGYLPTLTDGGNGGQTQVPSGMIDVDLIITGKNGETLFDRTIQVVENSSVMDALMKANQLDSSLQVKTKMGGTYVHSIKGQEAEGVDGWNYKVNGDKPDVGAKDTTLNDTDEVLWYWASADEDAVPVEQAEDAIADKINKLMRQLTEASGNIPRMQIIGENRLKGKELQDLKQLLASNTINLKQQVTVDKETVIQDEQKEMIVQIPGHALAEEMEIMAKKLKKAEAQVNQKGDYLSEIYQFGPAGTRFEEPITLNLKVAIDENESLDDVILAWYNEEKHLWMPVPAILDIEHGTITGMVEQLGHFAVLKQPAFSDLTSTWNWAKDAIDSLAQQKIVNGINGEFQPAGKVKRGEFVKLLVEALDLGAESASDSVPFHDIDQHWAKSYVTRAYQAGIVHGFADGSFQPESTITRSQMAVMLAQAFEAKLKNLQMGEVEAELQSFQDTKNIPAWAQAAVAKVKQAGWMKGKADGTIFASTDITTRAEAAVVIYRTLLSNP